MPGTAEIRFAKGAAAQALGRKVARPGPGLVPRAVPRQRRGGEYRDRRPRVSRMEVDRCARASGVDRAFQARPLPTATARVCRSPVRYDDVSDDGQVRSPVTGGPTSVADRFNAGTIIARWERQGFDVRRYFDGLEIVELRRCD